MRARLTDLPAVRPPMASRDAGATAVVKGSS